MPAESIQAILPEFRSTEAYIRDAVLAQKLVIDPPKLIVAAGEAFDDQGGVALRFLQNCATVACYYKVVDDSNAATAPSNPSAIDFHGVMNACTVQDDGTGGQMDCSRFKGRILVAGVGGGAVRLATFQGRGPEMGMESLQENPTK